MNPQLHITIKALPEETDIATELADCEQDTIDRIIADSQTNDWAWCVAEVSVSLGSLTATAYLGSCSYADEQEFKDSVYYQELVDDCKHQLRISSQYIIAHQYLIS